MGKRNTQKAQHERNLSDMLAELEDGIGQKDTVFIGDVIGIFSASSFGPLLILPMLITILPTGAIPFVPAICALIVIFVSAQWLFGTERPWLPKRLTQIKISPKDLKKGVKQAKPYTQKIDKWTSQRLTFLLNPITQRLIAIITIILSIAMVIIGGIPGLPAVLGLPILFFGIGYMVRDGLVIGLGLIFSFASTYILLENV